MHSPQGAPSGPRSTSQDATRRPLLDPATARVAVVIPALNEALTLPGVLQALPPVHRIVVVDNGSTDQTAQLAEAGGATVLSEPIAGYGRAVKAGFHWLAAHDPPDIVVVLDADHAESPERLGELTAPLLNNTADCAFSDRTEQATPGALTPAQRLGNALATRIIARWTGRVFRDLGPFRALRFDVLPVLALTDDTWGFNVEMQIRAVQRGLRVVEVSLPYRPRPAGESKISGTMIGTVRAGYKILLTLARHRPR